MSSCDLDLTCYLVVTLTHRNHKVWDVEICSVPLSIVIVSSSLDLALVILTFKWLSGVYLGNHKV